MIPVMFPGNLLEVFIPEGLLSSAGVYDSQGVLVRTLWSSVANHPNRNDPEEAWDGTIDNFTTINTVAPTGDYIIKVLSHSCTYTWEGVVGNTSTNHDTLDYWNYNSPIFDMECDPAGKVWFGAGYNEKKATFGYFLSSDPQVARIHRTNTGQWGPTTYCTSDGIIAYFVMFIAPSSAIYGIDIAAADFVQFPAGVDIAGVTKVGIAFETGVGGNEYILSMAVQRTGNFLFATRNAMNKVMTINKTSGAVVQNNLTFTDPRQLEVSPFNDDLWMCHQVAGVYRITKCAVDGAGNITLTGVQTTHTFTGTPTSMSISPDGTTMLVTDSGLHQVVAFNTSDASLKTAFGSGGFFGEAGGYASSPDVTNTKWMFNSAPHAYPGNAGLVAYMLDGSFWLGDGGNGRLIHFSAGNSPVYITQSMYQPIHYACQVCKGDPTRVFVGVKEFSINYNLPLSPTNGSWTLVRNWGQAIIDGSILHDNFSQMKYVGVYGNGKTYAASTFAHGNPNHKWFELTATGQRDTGAQLDPNMYVDVDMNQYFVNYTGVGNQGQINGNAFSGFDGLDNPTWVHGPLWTGGFTNVLTTEPIPARMCVFGGQLNGSLAQWAHAVPTLNNIIACSDHNGNTGFTGTPGAPHTPYINHMGGIDATTGKFMWAVNPHPGNVHDNAGQEWLLYPDKPFFTIANGMGANAGGLCLMDPGQPHIFFNNIGEGGWGNNQTNVWVHYHDSGLMVDRFGVPLPFFAAKSLTDPFALTGGFPNSFTRIWKGMPEAAGNSRWGGHAVVDGKFYLYQSDEWYHSGLHRWRVDGLDTISIQSTPVSWNSGSYVPPTPDPNLLLDGLPFDTLNVPNGSGGWTRFPTTDAAGISLRTSVIQCEVRKPPDLTYQVQVSSAGGNPFVVRNVTRVGTGNWTIAGTIYLQRGTDENFNPDDNNYMSFQILDNTDKVIFDIHAAAVPASMTAIIANGEHLITFAGDPAVSADTKLLFVCQDRTPFSVSANVAGGTMSVTYRGVTESRTPFEVGASLTNVAKVRIWHRTIVSAAGPSLNGVSLIELRYSEP